MKCSEAETITNRGCLNPMHPLPWFRRVRPWAGSPHWGWKTAQYSAYTSHLLWKTGRWCGPLGCPQGQEEAVALVAVTHQWGAASHSPHPPHSSRLVTQALRPWEESCQTKWGHLGVCPWSSKQQP